METLTIRLYYKKKQTPLPSGKWNQWKLRTKRNRVEKQEKPRFPLGSGINGNLGVNHVQNL
ncbi:hypothetical protein CRC_03135 [Cylindrospermopsis raciborskii CS-505]|nr:hypothetical protein CRC_03135 [Cylindrospermopsis raciborskii CS-505]